MTDRYVTVKKIQLTKQQAEFLLDCIQYADKNHPRVSMKALDTLGPDLVRMLQEVVGGE